MTALFGFLLSVTLFSFSPNGNVAIHHASETSHVSENANFMPTFTDSTFTVENKTSVNVGWVTIYEANSTNANVNVNATGTFTTTLTDYPTECSIHGHSFGIGVPTRVIIDAHTSVRATWTSSYLVLDDDETM